MGSHSKLTNHVVFSTKRGPSLTVIIASVLLATGVLAETSAIYSIKTDGTELKVIVSAPKLNFGSVSVSPDGKMLAMDSWPVGGFDPTKVWVHVCKVDGSECRKLARGAMPKWSPNSKLIAYQDYYGMIGSAVMKTDGSGIERIAEKAGNPNWMDVGHIALLEWGRRNIRLIDLASGDEKKMSQEPIGDIQHGYAISQDGKQMCFVYGTGKNARLFILPTDDSKRPQVLHQGELRSGLNWHPLGKQIIFAEGAEQAEAGGQLAQLYIINLDDKSIEPIPGLNPEEFHLSPCYSHDGQHIYFRSRMQ